MTKKFLVVDNDFNRVNYPQLVGQIFDTPPAYARVKEIEVLEKSNIKLNKCK